jgi:hypothetical protein
MAMKMKKTSMKGMLYLFVILVVLLPIAALLFKSIFGISITERFSNMVVPNIPSEFGMKQFGSKMLPCRSPDGRSSCPEGTFCDSNSNSCTSVTVKGSVNVPGYFA